MPRLSRYLQASACLIPMVGGVSLAETVSVPPAGAATTSCNTVNNGAFKTCLITTSGDVKAGGDGNGNQCALGTVHVELLNLTTGATYNSGSLFPWCGTSLGTSAHPNNGQRWEAILWQYTTHYQAIVSVTHDY